MISLSDHKFLEIIMVFATKKPRKCSDFPDQTDFTKTQSFLSQLEKAWKKSPLKPKGIFFSNQTKKDCSCNQKNNLTADFVANSWWRRMRRRGSWRPPRSSSRKLRSGKGPKGRIREGEGPKGRIRSGEGPKWRIREGGEKKYK